jgi:uncharacterized protein (TIGR03083 family)
MHREAALEVLEREAGRVLEIAGDAGADMGWPVPTCPGWTFGQLVEHVGRVYAMVATAVTGDPDRPVERATIPRRPDAQAPAEWFGERLGILLPLLREVPETARAWNFVDGPGSPVSFWWRRQAHETLIHRVDAELAAGAAVGEVAPAVAADGLGDFLTLAGLRLVEWDELELGAGPTIHLHADDAGAGAGAVAAEWTIDVERRTYSVAHLKADVAVRGPAWALDRWCWRRDVAADAGVLEIFGDRAAAEAWRPAH